MKLAPPTRANCPTGAILRSTQYPESGIQLAGSCLRSQNLWHAPWQNVASDRPCPQCGCMPTTSYQQEYPAPHRARRRHPEVLTLSLNVATSLAIGHGPTRHELKANRQIVICRKAVCSINHTLHESHETYFALTVAHEGEVAG